jgi:hypothetical protein
MVSKLVLNLLLDMFGVAYIILVQMGISLGGVFSCPPTEVSC